MVQVWPNNFLGMQTSVGGEGWLHCTILYGYGSEAIYGPREQALGVF